ncbi:MAG: signal peptidase II [Lachnospiraceae bacterium]
MLYLLFVILFVGLEYGLKTYAEKKLPQGKEVLILKGKIRLRRYHNRGAFLSLMESHRKLLKIISLLLTGMIAVFFCLTLFHSGNRLLKLSLTLLLGGAFSNTYDRLKRAYVVDYFSFQSPFPALNRIVFNLSDFAILIGSLLLVLQKS